MSPVEFIPLLEESSLIIPLGRWIIDTAAAQCNEWVKIIPQFVMHINLSFVQIAKSNVIKDVIENINKYEAGNEHFVFEITESIQMDSNIAIKRVLKEFVDNGFLLAIDDFGTGYSNFEYMKDKMFGILKIDRAFITDIHLTDNNRILVSFIIKMAHEMGVKICVEGVETKDELMAVTKLEADYIQGYYYGKPVKDVEFCRMIVKEKSEALNRPLTAVVSTFGCQMNARDSEKLLGILKDIGYQESDDEENADFVIYNTCTVRENANLRVYGRLGQLKKVKRANGEMIIAMCGCMMQEPEVVEKIKTSYKFVDIVFGTFNIFKLAELMYMCFTGDEQVIDIWDSTKEVVEELPTSRKYPFKSGVNIMFGCNNFCTYCIVPYVRGREKSREPKEIIREIERLVSDGVKEIMLLGQNVNSYGKTLDDNVTFAELLREIAKIDGLERIRFMTPHPKDLSDELIEAIRDNSKICNHIHLPLQSGSSRLLKLMNRQYTKEHYLELVDKIRNTIPDISITTDIIVGFPGETEEDFEDTLDVVRKAKYDSAYTFIYSKRTGTPAAKMDGQVSEDIVKDRFNRLLATVSEVSHEHIKRYEGMDMDVLVEDIDDHDNTFVTGRMTNNILVHFKGDKELIGSIVNVHLDECKGFYYMGTKND